MKDELFEELLQSVKEGGEILQGRRKAARTCRSESPTCAKCAEGTG